MKEGEGKGGKERKGEVVVEVHTHQRRYSFCTKLVLQLISDIKH